MNKQELVTAIAAKTGLSFRAAGEVVDAVFETIMDMVRDGDRVTISGFGSFDYIEQSARRARNPRTGEEIQLPASKRPRFVPGSKFREAAR